MPEIKLWMLAALLGAVVAGLNLWAVSDPGGFSRVARKFPRNLPAGFALMLLGTAWFVWNVSAEKNADFERMKTMMMVGFTVAGVASCFFVQDFLAVRGLAVVMLLVAKLMLDAQRWHGSSWRLVMAVWAYALIVAGIWFTVSPWRCRDFINWNIASQGRLRAFSGLGVAFGVFVVVLGLTVLR